MTVTAPRLPFTAIGVLLLGFLLGAPRAIGLERADADFLREAAAVGELEIRAGRIAQRKGTDARIRAFSAMMIKDHTAILSDLRALAQRRNTAAPGSLDPERIDRIDALQRAPVGHDFDDAYADLVEASQNSGLKLYGDAARTAGDPDVRSFASTILRTLERHRTLAGELDARDLMP